MAKVNPPASEAVVEIDDSLVEFYAANGWSVVPEPKKRVTAKDK